MELQWWKWPQIAKGALTWVPPLDAWRKRRLSTGGTNNPRYCYSVWLRHLITLSSLGFDARGAHVAELGPGESVGTGLAALLSGANSYIGLDLVNFAPAGTRAIFHELVEMYRTKTPVPNDAEFPRVKPSIGSYAFPDHLIDWSGFSERINQIDADIGHGLRNGSRAHYQAPWTSIADIEPGSLDLIFSQAVLEYVPVEMVYYAMSIWLKDGGYSSHVIDLSAHYLSPFSNGHWAYTDLEWKLACGRRETSLNREPLSRHLGLARKHGFEILLLHTDSSTSGLKPHQLSPRFRSLEPIDLETRGVTLVLRKFAK